MRDIIDIVPEGNQSGGQAGVAIRRDLKSVAVCWRDVNGGNTVGRITLEVGWVVVTGEGTVTREASVLSGSYRWRSDGLPGERRRDRDLGVCIARDTQGVGSATGIKPEAA